MDENIVWTVTIKSGYSEIAFDFRNHEMAISFADEATDFCRRNDDGFSVQIHATFAEEKAKSRSKEETAEC